MERITQDICTEIREPCCPPDESVFLLWLSTLGSAETWNFSCVTKSVLDTEDFGEFEKYFPDISNQFEDKIILKKTAIEKYTVADEFVEKSDVNALSEITYSPYVAIWLNGIFFRVRVIPQTQQYKDSSLGVMRVQFSFLMPQIQTVGN